MVGALESQLHRYKVQLACKFMASTKAIQTFGKKKVNDLYFADSRRPRPLSQLHTQKKVKDLTVCIHGHESRAA